MEKDYKQSEKAELLPENDSNYKGRIGAIGYGLNAVQQEAIADLWQWQEDSLKSEKIIGGPLEEKVWLFD